MSCLGCSCQGPAVVEATGRVMLSTRVGHTRSALLDVLRATGDSHLERAPGLIEVRTADAHGLLQTAVQMLSSVEAAEVRAIMLVAEQGDELLAAAIAAPTLAQLTARLEHADLLPLFATELESFRSVYQPIVTLSDSASEAVVVGYEALLRARTSTGELMPQAMFAAAEQAGWLHILDRVGRTTALRGAAGWLGNALLFVNFLPTTIYRPQVCLATTERAAELAGLRLDQLVFEVTESEQVTDLHHLEEVFAYYRERGCKVALDDLGAGYSSLNMLVRLRPDVVKLDKEIVQRLPEQVSQSIVSAVVDITHGYGGQVLAECVETAEQAAVARDLGVDLGQGWFFGRPEERMGLPGTEPAPTGAEWSMGVNFTGDDPAVALPAAAGVR
jgi:EAL domain-containing protein (putative c-di-GMP-specific phosphodiesterase class I)